MIHKKPQPGKIGTNLWAILDPTEGNNVSQRRNENGEVMTFPHSSTRSRLSQRTDRSRTRSVIAPLETNAILWASLFVAFFHSRVLF